MAYILEKTGEDSFVFKAASGRCNGSNYELKPIDRNLFVKDLREWAYRVDLRSIENGDTILFIDPTSEIFLSGTEIDYVSENYEEGNFGSSFVFKPEENLASSCGYGMLFSPKK